MALKDVVSGHGGGRLGLDWMILVVLSNLSDSLIRHPDDRPQDKETSGCHQVHLSARWVVRTKTTSCTVRTLVVEATITNSDQLSYPED